MTVGETLAELLAHPARTVIARWNWKSALLSAEPAWVATGAVAVIVPALAHGFEFAVHRTAGTPALYTSIAVSVGFSVVYDHLRSLPLLL